MSPWERERERDREREKERERERERESSRGGLTSGLAGEVDNHVTLKWCFKAENSRRKGSPGVPESHEIRNAKEQRDKINGKWSAK